MKKSKKILCAALALSLILGTGSCAGSGEGGGRSTETTAAPAAGTTTTLVNELDDVIDYAGIADSGEISTEHEEGTGPLYVAGQKAGLVKALSYYDFETDAPEIAGLLASRYGGYLETEITTSGSAYYERLNTMIASGDSPDLVRYDWPTFPSAIARNMYTALDEWLDIESPLWADETEIIEQFSFLGKHYYFPQGAMPSLAVVYNRVSIQETGLPDPMDLYESGEWDWNKFEEMMRTWVEQGSDYTGLRGAQWAAMMFINTTGTKFIGLENGELINNMKDSNVQRTMNWLTDMYRDGLIGDGWIHPADAFIDGKTLFLVMVLTWGYESAQEGMWKNGLDADIAVVPIPKDPQSDRYYLACDSLGYLVPAGAKNIQGGVDWILCSRIFNTDPEFVSADRAEKLDTNPVYYAKCANCKYSFTENNTNDLSACPECDTPRRRKFKATYSERQLNLIDDMLNPEKFELIYDGALGLGDDFTDLIVNNGEEAILDGPLYHGTSYTTLRDTYYNVIESYLDPYREILAANTSE